MDKPSCTSWDAYWDSLLETMGLLLPIGSMYGILYNANIGGILMGSMLPYIAAPWIRHG